MKLGMNIRNWGAAATAGTLAACAETADRSRLDSIWVNDHIGFPPQIAANEFALPAEFGDIVDPLAALAFLAARTHRIALGTAVLILPYRPMVLTAKWVAALQVLSRERLLLGVGAGWLAEEFRALGVERSRRGPITDATLEFLHRAFSDAVVEVHGQPLVLLPRPARPPFYVGGQPAVAIPRAVRAADGWMPVGMLPEALGAPIAELQQRAADAGRPPLEVIAMKTLPLAERAQAVELAQAFQNAGVTHLVHTQGYRDPAEYAAIVAQLEAEILPAVH